MTALFILGCVIFGGIIGMIIGIKNAPLVDDDGFIVPKEKEDEYLKDLQKSVDKIIEEVNKE